MKYWMIGFVLIFGIYGFHSNVSADTIMEKNAASINMAVQIGPKDGGKTPSPPTDPPKGSDQPVIDSAKPKNQLPPTLPTTGEIVGITLFVVGLLLSIAMLIVLRRNRDQQQSTDQIVVGSS